MKKTLFKALPLTVCACMMCAVPALAYDKSETVYTKTDSKGNITYQVVSEHLNSSKKETINDYSDLENIKNISGDEKYTQDGKNVTWSSTGDDIFYQGKSTSDLPITSDVTYKMDGKEVDISKYDGKKGHVEITFNYTNHEKHTYNGSTVYTPFVVVMGTTLSSDTTKNLKVSHGKIVNNGKSDVVVALASPGLYTDFKYDDFKDMDSVTVSFDTTDLDLNSFYSVASPKLLDTNDLDGVFDKIDDTYTSVNKLEDATNALVSGASKLAAGTKTYASKMKEADESASKLGTGVTTLVSSYSKINSGINTIYSKLSSNSGSLSKLTELSDGIGSLYTGVVTGTSSQTSLVSGAAQLKEGLAKLSDSSTGGKAIASAKTIISGVAAQYLAGISTKTGIPVSTLSTLYTTAISKGYISAAGVVTVDASNPYYAVYMAFITKTDELSYHLLESELAGLDSTTAGLSQLSSGASSLSSGVDQVAAGVTKMNNSKSELTSLASSLKELTEGMTTLNTGSTKFQSGLKEFAGYYTELSGGMDKLTSAFSSIVTGSASLESGIKTYKTEGIDKLSSAISKLNTADKKFKVLTDYADSYRYTATNSKCAYETKFVTITEE